MGEERILEKIYDPAKTEEKLYREWMERAIFMPCRIKARRLTR